MFSITASAETRSLLEQMQDASTLRNEETEANLSVSPYFDRLAIEIDVNR